MFGTTKQDFYATPEQSKWDEKYNQHTLKVNFAASVWGFVFLVPPVWILSNQFFTTLNSIRGGYLEALFKIVETRKPLIAVTLLIVVIGLLSFIPLNRYIAKSKLALGERPAGAAYRVTHENYVNRIIKPIPFSIRRVNNELHVFRVSGLHPSGPAYDFKIERLTDKQPFYEPEYYYRITEQYNRFPMCTTIAGNSLYGMSDEQISWYFSTLISVALEDNTNYFMESSYSI